MTDEELMLLLQQNDPLAFDELYRRHRQRVWAYFKRRSPADHADLFQECFMRLLERREQFQAGTPFLPWLMVIARNLHIDHWRKSKLRRHEELSEQASAEENWAEEIELWLAELPEQEAKVLRSHYLEGHDYESLARRFGSTAQSLRQRASRALKKLREGL